MGHRLVEVGASPWLWISNTYAVIICCLALLLRSLIRVRDYGLDDFLHALACVSLHSMCYGLEVTLLCRYWRWRLSDLSTEPSRKG